MEPNQVDVVAAAVLGSLEQILHTVETRLAGQIMSDIRDDESLRDGNTHP